MRRERNDRRRGRDREKKKERERERERAEREFKRSFGLVMDKDVDDHGGAVVAAREGVGACLLLSTLPGGRCINPPSHMLLSRDYTTSSHLARGVREPFLLARSSSINCPSVAVLLLIFFSHFKFT